jgi:hypothetical protein
LFGQVRGVGVVVQVVNPGVALKAADTTASAIIPVPKLSVKPTTFWQSNVAAVSVLFDPCVKERVFTCKLLYVADDHVVKPFVRAPAIVPPLLVSTLLFVRFTLQVILVVPDELGHEAFSISFEATSISSKLTASTAAAEPIPTMAITPHTSL